jgi:hypothetical protein
MDNLTEPQIAVAVVAIVGAISHATVAVMRAVQDYRVAIIKAHNGPPPANQSGSLGSPT